MPFNFVGKKVLVTGGAQGSDLGIGRAIVDALLANKATVFALDFNKQALEELHKEIPAVTVIAADLSDVEGTKAAVTPHGPFHGLVNNAGITILEDFLEMTEKAFDKVMTVNLKGAAFLSQIVAKGMIEGGIKGSIVHTSSTASKIPLKAHTSYCCSKAAIDSLAKTMAVELGPKGIRVNTVNPTVVMTEMGRKVWSDPAKSGPYLARVPVGHFAEPENVATAVCWLLSEESAMTTGHNLPVDGGYWAS